MVGEMMPITGSRYLKQAANSKENIINTLVFGASKYYTVVLHLQS
jgi:hypothetical protein